MTIFAYIRVSTDLQTTENQKKAILDAGFAVDKWVSEDGVSGSKPAFERPAFAAMMEEAVRDDTIICTMIDRIGRSTIDVLTTVDVFQKRNIRLRVIQFGGIDITSSMGKFTLTVMAACAEMERNMLVERTKAGLARTKTEGIHLGQPLKITPEELQGMIDDQYKGMTYKELSEKYSVHINTITRNIKKWKDNIGEYENEYYERLAQYDRAKSFTV